MKINFLGGVGQIGSNATHYQTENASFLVDYGIKFPRFKEIGVSKIFPNLDNLPKNTSLIITHIHEDHIGGLGEAYHKFKEIYAPPIAIEYISQKFSKIKLHTKLISYNYESHLLIDDQWSIYPFETFHSTPQTYGLHFYNKQESKLITHLSDFKSNGITIFKNQNQHFDLSKIRFNEHVFLCDSTNALSSKDFDVSESVIVEELKKLLMLKHKRYFISLFASNIERIKNISDLCEELGLKCSFLGESFAFYTKIGSSQNLCKHITQDLDADVFLVSGSQGEKFSYLWRLARDQADISLHESDCVLFSSRVIPGNESQFNHMLNLLSSKTSNLYFDGEYKLHCSGHAYWGDVKVALNELKPSFVIPIHGEFFHLSRLAKKINESELSKSQSLNNNSGFNITNIVFNLEDTLLSEFATDSSGGRRLFPADIKARRKMAERGIAFYNSKSNTLSAYGLPNCERVLEDINRELTTSKDSANIVLTKIKRRFEEKIGYVPILLST
ncbi:MAG: hypothetical protein Fur0010_09550 [Bdellovibrio sp.]